MNLPVGGITTIAERLNVTKYSRELDRVLGRCLMSPAGNPDALTSAIRRLLEVKYRLPSSPIWSSEATVTSADL